jgi:uncharacterized protein YicC (UPF0701 family)
MNPEEHNKLDKIYDTVERIHRGLYGDEINKQPGLMQKHYDLKEKVDRLEDHRKKAVYWGSGFLVAAGMAYEGVKKLFGI